MTTNHCTHRPPSPGQSLCQCGHQRIEMEYAARIAEAQVAAALAVANAAAQKTLAGVERRRGE